MSILRRLVLVALVVGVLAPAAVGCARAEGRGLPDSQWTVVSIDGAAPIPGSYLSLSLWADGSFSGWSGVNTCEGKWALTLREVRTGIRFFDMSATEIGSSPDLMRQEEAYFKGLMEASSFSVTSDRLRLLDTADRERVSLRRLPEYKADPARLAGTEWELEAVKGRPIADNTSMSLFFDEHGNARGQAGPFYYEIDFKAFGDSIRSAGVTSIRVGRLDDPGGMAGEGMSVLAMATTYQFDDDTLLVLSVKGETASFRRYHSPYADLPDPPALQPGAGEPSWAYMLEDMGELCANSDLIVMGTGRGYVGLNKEAYGTRVHAWQSAFRVEAVLKGTASREIILSHTIFEMQGAYYPDRTDPPVKAGERWLLFLRAGDDGTYTENGPWGRYKIVDSKVSSMNRVIHDNNPYFVPQLDFDGEGLVPFINRVTGALGSTILTFYEERHESPTSAFQFHSPGQSGSLIAKLSAGRSKQTDVTFVVKRVAGKDDTTELPMPTGLRVWMDPAELELAQYGEYRLMINAAASYDLPVGIYWLVVECQRGGPVIASRGVVVSIHPPEPATR